MGLSGAVKRMDSLMVASRCKRMSRLEIIYMVNTNSVRLLSQQGVAELISQGCAHYLEEDDHNDVIYCYRGEEAESRLQRVIDKAVALKKALTDAELTDKEEYGCSARCWKTR